MSRGAWLSKLDLYGVSYGTRVAQHYMRRYPQRVRVAILDGVVPPQLPLGPDVALDAQAAIDSAFARCDSNVDCKRAFPNIAGTFATLRARVLEKPITSVDSGSAERRAHARRSWARRS